MSHLAPSPARLLPLLLAATACAHRPVATDSRPLTVDDVAGCALKVATARGFDATRIAASTGPISVSIRASKNTAPDPIVLTAYIWQSDAGPRVDYRSNRQSRELSELARRISQTCVGSGAAAPGS